MVVLVLGSVSRAYTTSREEGSTSVASSNELDEDTRRVRRTGVVLAEEATTSTAPLATEGMFVERLGCKSSVEREREREIEDGVGLKEVKGLSYINKRATQSRNGRHTQESDNKFEFNFSRLPISDSDDRFF